VSTALTAPREHELEVAGLRIKSMRAGSGPPLLVLHHSTGNSGWTAFYERLAEEFEVMVPDLPGYGQSSLPEWAREPRDLAILALQYLRKQELRDVGVVGLGFGGFIAAEMATMDPGAIWSMVLVSAPGLKPEDGEVMDQMLLDHAEYVRAGFRDEATAVQHLGEEIDRNLVALWQFNRVMTARVSWKPYMFNPRLRHLLPEVHVPTLLIWGAADRVVPIAVGRQYERALPNARLEVVEGAGHLVEIEEPERVAALIREHAAERVPSLRPA
jgi:pimeloyl-ACP methyl ester carboxylesterase